MKFLVIFSLLTLGLLLLYSRIYPYLQALKKILNSARNISEANFNAAAPPRATNKVDGKLVRCVACGMWIPNDRALGSRTGASVYCSRACLEKGAGGENRKMAG